jgi:hypothetical protein
MRTVFLSFSSTNGYHHSRQRIQQEAKDSKWFDEVILCTEHDLPIDVQQKYLPGWYNQRGFGYYAWKGMIVHKIFQTLEEDDILVYIDTGCHINVKGGEARFKEYLEMCKTQGDNVAIQLPYKEKWYTKKATLDLFDPAFAETNQTLSGIFFLRKTPNMEKMVEEWKTLSEQPRYLNDDTANEDPTFKAHRHDQSILSLLRKKYGCVLIPDDETWDENWNSEFIMSKPFHAKRLRM